MELIVVKSRKNLMQNNIIENNYGTGKTLIETPCVLSSFYTDIQWYIFWCNQSILFQKVITKPKLSSTINNLLEFFAQNYFL